MAMNMASDSQDWRRKAAVEAAWAHVRSRAMIYRKADFGEAAEPWEDFNRALAELVRVAQACGPVPLAPEADVMEAG